MEIKQLESTNGFVIYDLPGADTYVGPTRLGAKLAPGNAEMLVRHQTSVFGLLAAQKRGATIALKVDPDDTEAAVAAVAEEMLADFESQSFLTSPGLRLNRNSLEPVLRYDKRNSLTLTDRDGVSFEEELLGLGAATAAALVVKPTNDWKVAIEGFNQVGLSVAREVERLGGHVERIATSKGCVTGQFDSSTLADAWMDSGVNCIEKLGAPGKPWDVWKADVDAIFVGSKPGAISGEGANGVATTPVIATSPAAISSKALAILRRNGAPAISDFLTGVGPALVWWASSEVDTEELRATTVNTVTHLLEEIDGHEDGAFMAACYKAEAFIESWQETRPFGRPLG
ncbi:MAG: hypothetical protein VX734_05855 [Actinomycetota bacterium]|nr:hypothetical protein [Actinomycetota bacterium]